MTVWIFSWFRSCFLGPFGGCRAGIALQPLLCEIGTIVVPAQLQFPKVTKILDENGTLLDDTYESKCQRMVKQLAWYAKALFNQKKAEGLP